MSNNDAAFLNYASVDDLAPRIRSGDLSPVDLVQAALARVDELDSKLLAFLDVYRDGALQAARAAEREIRDGHYRGPLHGIPVGLKDLVDVAGTPTTGGSPILKDNVAKTDATVTKRLRDAGAIIMGKLNLVEFALGATGVNPHTGTARNPWNTDYVTAGSSSGSAASVASGMLMGALGSDTGGSIRMPASLCGIAGLKPTYGRVSRAGVLDLSWSLDHVGPLTRRTSDCAHMMNALAGYDPADPASSREPVPDFTADMGRGVDGVRVGVPQEYFFDDVDPEIESAVRAAIDLLEKNGASVTDVSMPWAGSGRSINMGIMLPEAVAVHEKWLNEHADMYSPEVRARIQAAFTTPAIDYIRAQRARRWFCEQMTDAMRGVDVLITPTVPVRTPSIEGCTPLPGENEGREGARLAVFTGVFDTTGQPSLSVPCGFTTDGMPIGMMITGKAFDEVMVLRVGDAYEALAGWHERHPPV